MNHKKYLLQLGPNLNFITGRNGAGKSAFTIALQVCLGAKSERSSRLSGLIREGSTGPAKVRVTLSNIGSDAYLPEIYGKSLSIERRIYSSGASQYFIRSQNMEVPYPTLIVISFF
jgi:chromosome segregation ATPase